MKTAKKEKLSVLLEKAGLSESQIRAISKTAEKYPYMVSDYYLGLINMDDPLNDPVWKQCVPSPDELRDFPGFEQEDGLGERSQSPVPRLIHRYPDRVVILATNRCPVHCRFCFRKRRWKSGEKLSDISVSELKNICAYLEKHREIRDVLLSGGDPLMMSDKSIKKALTMLFSAGSVETVRICSRMPATLPARITPDFAAMLSEFEGLWFVTHFNHAAEITEDSRRACRLILAAGVPMLNQTVLLKGVNDSAEILEDLFRKLVRMRIKPHYLFHIDPIKGAGHFATGVEKGLEIISRFRETLSSIAVPVFALDLPEGGGKVPLQADYSDGDAFRSIDGRTIRHPGQHRAGASRVK